MHTEKAELIQEFLKSPVFANNWNLRGWLSVIMFIIGNDFIQPSSPSCWARKCYGYLHSTSTEAQGSPAEREYFRGMVVVNLGSVFFLTTKTKLTIIRIFIKILYL